MQDHAIYPPQLVEPPDLIKRSKVTINNHKYKQLIKLDINNNTIDEEAAVNKLEFTGINFFFLGAITDIIKIKPKVTFVTIWILAQNGSQVI